MVLEDLGYQILRHSSPPPAAAYAPILHSRTRRLLDTSILHLTPYEPLVDRAVPADGLAQLLRGLPFRTLFRDSASDHVGADTPGFPVVVGDVRVHHGEAAFLQDLRDGAVGQLYGPPRVVDEDALDLAPPLLVASLALLGERLYLALDLPTALPELPLGLLLGAPFLRSPLVLAPELLPGPLALLLAPLRTPPARHEVDYEKHDHCQDRQTD